MSVRAVLAVFLSWAISTSLSAAAFGQAADAPEGAAMPDADRIRISDANPRYWQYGGRMVLLLGGSVEDNLFQIPDIKEHLDLLASVGGNYVRCTMSCRDEGNTWPFARVADKYDLDLWNEEFWGRFERFLTLTAQRGIIVQIEVWATFDYYRNFWEVNPFNPKNNSTYTVEQSGLPTEVNSHPVRTENNFFWSVPAERNQEMVLKYQLRFVDKMLSYSLKYGNVLYCMDNETSVTPEWGKYWSEHIKTRAAQAGVHVETTEMWDAHDIFHAQHSNTLDHPETYSFCDTSQNNHQKGETHWNNMQRFRAELSPVRPINNVKIYGADTGRYGTGQDGKERFWRNVLGGLASARFHRPDSGLGLGAEAQAHIKSARMLTDAMDIFAAEPHNDLLSERAENGAYCAAIPGKEYAVYFPAGQAATIDLGFAAGKMAMRWLDIGKSEWMATEAIEADGKLRLQPPGKGHWAALITANG